MTCRACFLALPITIVTALVRSDTDTPRQANSMKPMGFLDSVSAFRVIPGDWAICQAIRNYEANLSH